MIKSWSFLVLFFFVQCSQVSGTKYYVSSSIGSDEPGRDGKSKATAWKTISKINGMNLLPGDSILFMKGDTWREMLKVPSSGSPSAYIYFGSYGNSTVKPKILGSNQATNWENQGSNIWKSDIIFTNPYASIYSAAEIFFEEAKGKVIWGVHKSDIASLTAEYHWTWIDNYIYVYSESDPDTRYTSVEVPQRNAVINIGNSNEYITIDGFDMKYAKSFTVTDDDPETSLSGFTLMNCRLSYVGSKTELLGYNCGICRNNMLIKKNEIYEGGRRQISIHIYDADDLTFSNIIIEGNTCYDGYHGSGFGIAMDGSRHGNKFKDIIIRNNLFYNNPNRYPVEGGWNYSSLGAMRAGETGSAIENVQIYNNLFRYVESVGVGLENVDNVKVYNNTFYDFNHHIARGQGNLYHIELANGCTQVDIKNNIFYGSNDWAYVGANQNIYIQPTQPTANVSIDYNLFYQVATSMGMVYTGTNDTYYRTTNWSALSKDYPKWQANDPGLLDPLFKNPPEDLDLAYNSPAIRKGVDVGLPTDYAGNYYDTIPSIGAYEGNPAFEPPPVVPPESDNFTFNVYPNPANKSITISRTGTDFTGQKFRIVSFSGSVIYIGVLQAESRPQQFPIDINPGIYIVQLISGKKTIDAQKLMVVY